MKKSEFLVALEDILQTEDPVGLTQDLTALEEWDSLSKMAVMAYYDKNFKVKIGLNQLGEIKTVSDLIKLAGENIND